MKMADRIVERAAEAMVEHQLKAWDYRDEAAERVREQQMVSARVYARIAIKFAIEAAMDELEAEGV